MAKIIDSSANISGLNIAYTFLGGKMYFMTSKGFKVKNYNIEDIVDIQEMDEEVYRSGGKAAVGAIVGGVLTGGVGLLLGAAIGGRRRKQSVVFVSFTDGEHVCFQETNSKNAQSISTLILKRQSAAMAAR